MKGTHYCCAAAIAALCLSATAAQAGGTNTFGVGLEGFQDTYKESDIDESSTTDGGSATGYFSHQFGKNFIALDARGSYGTERYSAQGPFTADTLALARGSVNGVPQWEFEMRARFGRTYQVWGGDISPYIGLGIRYTRDEGKGYVTDAGYGDFDTDTWQFYVPIGASYSQPLGDGWSITPMAEGDIMFYGDVNQRVTNLGDFNITADNEQHFGLGGRAELMFGKDMGGYGIQVGPFIRYWWVQESDTTQYQILSAGPGSTPTGATLPISQPENTSAEVGGALRLVW